MTRRPADFPPEAWGRSLEGSFERLGRATLRAYCAAVPRDLRRHLLWTLDWGPFGLLFAILVAQVGVPVLAVLGRFVR